MFPGHVLQRELEAMLDRPLAASIAFAPAMDVTSEAGRAWVDTLRLIERQASYAHGLLAHPLAAAHLERLLVAGLLLAQPHNYTDTLSGPRQPAAPPAVRQAIELIRGHPEQPWTTAALARRVAVSARSLQDGFARSVGIPPSQVSAIGAVDPRTRRAAVGRPAHDRSPRSPSGVDSSASVGSRPPTARSSASAPQPPVTNVMTGHT
jgi:hypothetical protein